jgi:hypothetical protein
MTRIGRLLRKTRKKALELYQEQLDFYNLNEDDKKVLDQLSNYLRHPWKKYLLITNPRTYVEALRKMKIDLDLFKEHQEKLAGKLEGRKYIQSRCPVSSAEFRINHQIVLLANDNVCLAEIIAADDEVFSCKKISGESDWDEEGQITFLYPYGNGLSAGVTTLLGNDGENEAENQNEDDSEDDNNSEVFQLKAVDLASPADLEYNSLDVEVFVRKITTASLLVPGRLQKIKGCKLHLEIDQHKLKVHNDIKVFFSPVKGAVPVNAEIASVRRNRIIVDTGYFR